MVQYPAAPDSRSIRICPAYRNASAEAANQLRVASSRSGPDVLSMVVLGTKCHMMNESEKDSGGDRWLACPLPFAPRHDCSAFYTTIY